MSCCNVLLIQGGGEGAGGANLSQEVKKVSTSPELWALSLSFITAEQAKKYFFKRVYHTPRRQTVHYKFKIQHLVKKC